MRIFKEKFELFYGHKMLGEQVEKAQGTGG
jgi:hypothetical protein